MARVEPEAAPRDVALVEPVAISLARLLDDESQAAEASLFFLAEHGGQACVPLFVRPPHGPDLDVDGALARRRREPRERAEDLSEPPEAVGGSMMIVPARDRRDDVSRRHLAAAAAAADLPPVALVQQVEPLLADSELANEDVERPVEVGLP